MIETHLRNLRKTAQYKDAMIYVLVERNYGGSWSVDIIRQIVEQKEFSPLICYQEKEDDKFGIW